MGSLEGFIESIIWKGVIFKFEQLQGGNYEKISEDPDAFLGKQERLRMDCENNFKMLFWWMDDWFLPRGWFVKGFFR